MTILTISVSLYMNTACYAATDSLSNGIHFEKGLTWKQIIAKAELGNKYILVDCFATWCGPCKKMDKEVYPVKEVGDYFNDKFISVKVQMDTAANDDVDTWNFYGDAQSIRNQFKISAYPTLLVLNPDGNLLNASVGFMDPQSLVKFAKDATGLDKDYDNLLKQYNEGRHDLNEMAFLARTAEGRLQDHKQANLIVSEYIRFVYNKNRFTKENIQFCRAFTSKSSDLGFAFFYKNAYKINTTMEADTYSQDVIQSILYKEFVLPVMHNKTSAMDEPDWKKVASKIAMKYGRYYAALVTTEARRNWAAKTKNWPEYTKYLCVYVEKYGSKSDGGGVMESYYLNGCAWSVLTRSNDPNELKIALKWSLRAIAIEPTVEGMDTYANILYKLKKTDLAIKWESIASALCNHKVPVFESTLTKMKEGAPAPWDTKVN